jgi:transcriptional regulator with XRE-family HTH domain
MYRSGVWQPVLTPTLARMETWGSYLRRHRLARGLRQIDVASMAGVSEDTIVRQETRGQKPQNRESIKAIIKAVGMDPVEALRVIFELDDQLPSPQLPAELIEVNRHYWTADEITKLHILAMVRIINEHVSQMLDTRHVKAS